MQRNEEAMNTDGNFQKKFIISIVRLTNIVIFVFTYVLESFALFYGDFCMDLYSVDCDEAMKQANEALTASSL
jgi:hypothetical protein